MLNRPVVAEFLGLTAEQQDQVSRVYGDAEKARVRQGPWTYEEHLEITRKAIAILSDKQKHLWAKVLGRPCRFVIAIGPAGCCSRRSRATGGDPTSITDSTERLLASSELLGSASREGGSGSRSVEAPSMIVWVRVSSMSGLKPWIKAKSRSHDRLPPRSASPRALYISA